MSWKAVVLSAALTLAAGCSSAPPGRRDSAPSPAPAAPASSGPARPSSPFPYEGYRTDGGQIVKWLGSFCESIEADTGPGLTICEPDLKDREKTFTIFTFKRVSQFKRFLATTGDKPVNPVCRLVLPGLVVLAAPGTLLRAGLRQDPAAFAREHDGRIEGNDC